MNDQELLITLARTFAKESDERGETIKDFERRIAAWFEKTCGQNTAGVAAYKLADLVGRQRVYRNGR